MHDPKNPKSPQLSTRLMNSETEHRLYTSSTLLQWLALLLLTLLVLDVEVIFSTEYFIGGDTRDTFDHIALIDLWQTETSFWNFPEGGSVLPPDFFGMLFAAPFLSLGRGIAYDLSIVIQIWCNAMSGWFLGWNIGEERKAGVAWVGAIAIGFSPYVLGQVNSGEMETLSIWPLVLFCVAISRQRWREAGVWATITAIGSWYYGAYAAILLCLMVGVTLCRERFTSMKPLEGIGIFAVLIAGPAFIYASFLHKTDQMFRGPTMRDYLEEQPRALAGFSSDPLAWFSEPAADANHVDSLGWVFLLFAGLGFWRASRQFRFFWGVLLGIGLVLSLGPRLHISQVAIWEWMPYDLLILIPPLDLMRLPHRWIAIAMIALGAMIVKGARNLPVLASMLLLGESIWFVLPQREATEVKLPEVIAYFEGPVLQLPARTMEEDARGPYLVMQREHGQPIPYSLLMQGWSMAISEEPLVIGVSSLDSSDPISSRPAEARQFRQEDFAMAVAAWHDDDQVIGAGDRLKAKGFSQVCLHLDRLPKQDIQSIKELVEKGLGEPDIRTAEALLWNL